MTVKVLLDPVYTAKPASCSGVIIYRKFVEQVLAERDDVFFYWLVPAWVQPEDRVWLPDHPNIRYIEVTSVKDRTQEYLNFPRELDGLIAFNGQLWDFDVLVTSRTGLAALMKMCITSPRQSGAAWLKEVWVLEVMPVMTFKPKVMTIDPAVQDHFTLNGCLAADTVYVCSFHEKRPMLQRAREIFAPSEVRRLDLKMHEVLLTILEGYQLKKPEHRFVKGKRPFCMAYIGRIVPTNNVASAYEVMEKSWIMKGDSGIKLLTCTATEALKVPPPAAMEVKRLPREEFWRTVKEEMDLGIALYPDSGFSAALAEPIVMGTPIIVHKADWSIGMFGPDYPFFVTTELQAYAMAKAFHDDYEGMYAKFAAWHAEHLIPLFEKRRKECWAYRLMADRLAAFEQESGDRYREVYAAKTGNAIAQAIRDHVVGRDEFVLFDVLAELDAAGVLQSIGDKLEEGDRETRGLAYATAWNEFRRIFKELYGWEDASTTVGHLRRKKDAQA